jgi:hypothetical protein
MANYLRMLTKDRKQKYETSCGAAWWTDSVPRISGHPPRLVGGERTLPFTRIGNCPCKCVVARYPECCSGNCFRSTTRKTDFRERTEAGFITSVSGESFQERSQETNSRKQTPEVVVMLPPKLRFCGTISNLRGYIMPLICVSLL